MTPSVTIRRAALTDMAVGKKIFGGGSIRPSAWSLFSQHDALGDTFRRLLRALRASGFPHVFVGTAALQAYGLSEDARPGSGVLEVVMHAGDLDRFRAEVLQGEFQALPGQRTRLFDPLTQVEVDLIDAGTSVNDPLLAAAGLKLPDPRAAVEIGQTPVPPLERMVEWLLGRNRPGGRQRVAELVGRERLDAAFVKRLHSAVRGMIETNLV